MSAFEIIHIIDHKTGGGVWVTEAIIEQGDRQGHVDAFLYFTELPDGTLSLANRNLHFVSQRTPAASRAAAVALACSLDTNHDLNATFERLTHRLPTVTRVTVVSDRDMEFPEQYKPHLIVELK